MGILRSDVVSHSQLEPTGSVFFDGSDDKITTTGPGNIGTSDFTIECWVYLSTTAGIQRIISANEGSQSTEYIQIRTHSSHGWQGYIGTDSGWWEAHSNNDHSTFTTGWHHVVLERYGNDGYIFVDGQDVTLDHDGSSASNAADPVTWTQVVLGHGYGSEYLNAGYISNARISLTAVYEGKEFTVPKFELDAIGGTYLLCCQSSSSSTEAAVSPAGLTVTGAAASAVAPDVKKDITDIGVLFEDNTKFDTLSYMVPPGGTTAQSNRGRAVMAGGETPSNTTNIQYVQMQSDGNATKFGSLTTASRKQFSCASSTRGIFGSGYAPSGTNVIEYVTIATTSNVTNFGDIANDGQCQGCSNNTRGIIAGGYGNPADNVVSYLTIATAGNSSDFGDLTTGRFDIACLASSTRGLLPGGNAGAAANNTISYVTIASTGNDTDFGDSTSAFSAGSGVASSTRGGFALCTSQVNTIDYVTIASAGNAADFGDLTDGRSEIMNGGTSNSIRGLFCGGQAPTIVNTIDYITIASTGNAKDFGDMNVTASATAAVSDSHGGIS